MLRIHFWIKIWRILKYPLVIFFSPQINLRKYLQSAFQILSFRQFQQTPLEKLETKGVKIAWQTELIILLTRETKECDTGQADTKTISKYYRHQKNKS